jgi:protein ImuB
MRVVALDEAASLAGLRQGQGLADARAICPDIDVLGEDPAADRLLLEAVADWCDRYTPLVGIDAPGLDEADAFAHGLILDIAGCAHLFGGEAALLGDLLSRLFEQGFEARAAIAATPGAAWALSRFCAAQHPAAGVVCEIAGEGLADTLSPLPLAALRIGGETVSAMERLGLYRVGQALFRPRAPLARRFGRMLLLRLDQALGRVEEAISPRLPPPVFSAERRLAEPVSRIEDVEALALRLAGHLCAQMEQRGEGARLLDLALFRVDGAVRRIGAGASRPLREPATMLRLLRERIASCGDELDAGCGFDMLRLSASLTEPLDPVQRGLAARIGGDDGGEAPAAQAAQAAQAARADLADRLAARLGAGRVLRARTGDGHAPEAGQVLVDAMHGRRGEEDFAAACPGAQAPDIPPARPLRLFGRPEPVEAVAEVPDGPPLRFRWRRALFCVTRAEGPERIAGQWWPGADATARTRDYFRIEEAGGRRFWLFREGLYGEEAGTRWFLHGLFA